MLQQHPENPYFAILLGEAYRAKGNSQQAIKLHDQMGFILNRDWLIIGSWITHSDYHGLRVDEYIVPVELKSELNKILVKVVQRGEKVTGFYLRFTGKNGKTLDNTVS